MTLPPTFLAETTYGAIMFWCLVLIILLVGGFFVVSFIRKSMRAEESLGPPGGFTLSQLRKLRDSGEMSKEEYDKAVHGVVASSHAAIDQKLPPRVKD